MNLKHKIKSSNELTLTVILIISTLCVGFLSPDRFFTFNNLMSTLRQMPEFGILALAMMFPVITGGINLSIVTTATMSGIISSYFLTGALSKQNPVLAIILAVLLSLCVSIIAGIINGYFTAYVGVAAMLVTLGTTTLFEGISLNLTKGGSVSGFPLIFSYITIKNFLGIPVPFIVYMTVVFISYLILHKSTLGMKIFMVGCNETATRFSGINTKKVILVTYIYSALLSAISGIVMMSRYNSAKVDFGSSYLMQSITAVVLGGVSISGGHGNILGTVIAVAVIQVISKGLNLINVDRNIVDIIMGAILITVLAIKYISKIFRDKSLITKRKNKTA
ncbi:MAG: ABC transporter permease [Leptotrichiaceae bacterium]|nr:ABC transporter permease [Leptotrichiaceae bacterium]